MCGYVHKYVCMCGCVHVWVCMCGCVHKCVCVLQLWAPSQAVSFRRKGEKKEVGEKEMERSCTYVITIKEEGAEEGIFQSKETGGWAWGSRRAPHIKAGLQAALQRGGCVWLPSQPGCLATDQLTLEKASSLNRTEMTLGSLWSRGSDLPRDWGWGKWSRKHRELFWEEVFPPKHREGTKDPPGQDQGQQI